MFKLIFNFLLISLFSLYLISCSSDNPADPLLVQSTSDPEITKPSENLTVNIAISPGLSVAGSKFSFKFSLYKGTDTIPNVNEYQYRLDIGNDGYFEMDWTAVDTFNAVIEQYGEIPIKLEAKSPEEQIVSCISSIKLYEVIKIANTPNSFPGELVWSKDGSNKIAFVWRPTSSGHQIYTVNYPSGTITQATPDNDTCKHYPEWSPDGTKIAVTYQNKIFIKDIQTGNFSPLIDSVYSCKNIAWDPSNKYILYESEYNIYKYTFEDKKKILLPFTTGSMCLDPTGKLAAYYADGKLNIYNLETNSAVNAFPVPKSPYLIDWSLNGHIAFGALSDNDIHLLNAGNGEIITIYTNRFDRVDKEFAWSPDGSILAFPAKEKGDDNTNIYGIRIGSESEPGNIGIVD